MTEQGEDVDVQSLRVGDVVDVRFEVATKDVDNPYELRRSSSRILSRWSRDSAHPVVTKMKRGV